MLVGKTRRALGALGDDLSTHRMQKRCDLARASRACASRVCPPTLKRVLTQRWAIRHWIELQLQTAAWKLV